MSFSNRRKPPLPLFRINTNVKEKEKESAPATPPDADEQEKEEEKEKEELWKRCARGVVQSVAWIPENWTWSNIKPVIRCAVAAWTSTVLFLIPAVERLMGQASFLVLIASFLSPPAEPFVAVLEREFLILLFSAGAWAWGCLGIFLANRARTHHDPNVTLLHAITGQYIEAAPTVIIGVFIFLGSCFFLYIKARTGPGPYLFATIFACICLDISLTTAVLFPWPFYLSGRAILLPLTFHSAIALLSSILIFPCTISSQFTSRLQAVIAPFEASLSLHRQLLHTPTTDLPAFSEITTSIVNAVNQAEAAFVPLAASARLLGNDTIYARFAPTDFKEFQKMMRRIIGRANGMSMYFALIDPTRERFPVTPAHSVIQTPVMSATPVLGSSTPTTASRDTSPERRQHKKDESRNATDDEKEGEHRRHQHHEKQSLHRRRRGRTSGAGGVSHGHSHGHSHSHSHPHHHHHNLLHNALLHLSRQHHLGLAHRSYTGSGTFGGTVFGLGSHGVTEQAVGVFESHKYMNLEATRLHHPDAEMHTSWTTRLLNESCHDLIGSCQTGVGQVREWLGTVRNDRFNFWVSRYDKEAKQRKMLDEVVRVRDELESALDRFKKDDRHKVLEPYKAAFESHGHQDEDIDIPPHRHLFHCYVYQYHLMQMASNIITMLDGIIKLENERPRPRLWTPVKGLLALLIWTTWDVTETTDREEDEDPNRIQGLGPSIMEDLNLPRRRDPDALPPRNAFESMLSRVYHSIVSLGGGNCLFALKAGCLTILLCLPSFFKSSAHFAYVNRFVWAIFMGQLTIARFRGDTAFGLVARIMSTFGGGVVGIAMWYIACGSGREETFAYGLAAVCGFCFPFFFYARLYWPVPPMTNIVFFVTAVLVVGYSYQDIHLPVPGSPGSGFEVAWRRFVLVTVGVCSAFVFSFLPPSTTIRSYQRHILATTSCEMGGLYCSVLSFANSSRRDEDIQEIITSLIAIRSKLKRSEALRTNVIYEFSLRGRWPMKRYKKIQELQMQIAYCLSHLLSVVEHLEPAWTRAFLKRTRCIDADFQGDILAVINMISASLRTGTPLPQITPCPLLDRFMLRYHGLDVIHKDSEEDYGLPRVLTMDILMNEQYLMFCVGVSTMFALMIRLDKLMLATKEVVGEQYHIHGLGLQHIGVDMGPRTNSVHYAPPTPREV
ncbi:hypothetical protein AX16_009482 [Volvariella volvacea WC 439]|nr:hypothetical protein AX16_009482 [Volvariella volvacea WC 439]